MTTSQREHLYYDISAIKEIPILSVADRMGIAVEKRGKNYWCKIRQEQNPSVILHPDRNTFYDFGNQVHGDVISFVCYAQDIKPGEAIRYLGENFALTPNVSRQELLLRPLTNWEYKQIGLYGDMASKNIVFPIDMLSLEELCEMSQYYQMPMNKLSKEEPGVFRTLIHNKAEPFVENMRNSYYLDVWNYFHLCYALGDNSINLFQAQKVRNRFNKDTRDLNRAERLLYRVKKTAGLEAPEPQRHDPVSVIRNLLHGNLSIVLGNISHKDLDLQANRLGGSVYEAKIPLYSYFDDRLQCFCHAAQYQGGKVTVRYLSFNKKELAPILEELQKMPDRELEKRIEEKVEEKQTLAQTKKEFHKIYEIH